eukprot:1149265-Prorocentrum_lima.AAC.1
MPHLLASVPAEWSGPHAWHPCEIFEFMAGEAGGSCKIQDSNCSVYPHYQRKQGRFLEIFETAGSTGIPGL